MFHHEPKFWEVTSVGERGQIVIPNKIRKDLDLKKGDKLMVFCRHKHFIGLIKLSDITGRLRRWLDRIEGINLKT